MVPLRMGRVLFLVIALFSTGVRAADEAASSNQDDAVTIRCAVIGGMTDTGFWQELAARFKQATDIDSHVVATGPKHVIAGAFREGEADLITMHASDTIINLVADGFAADPQPWARNDLLWVGPPDDPAQIRGKTNGVDALRRIIESGSRLLVHQSLGTNEVLHDLLAEGELELELENTVSLPSDRHRQLLRRAAQEHAYTLVGRIPFLNGKIESGDLQIMVQGDKRMRRPYVVAVATINPSGSPRRLAAERLAAFLRTRETQSWIAEFGRGQLDEFPLFFPVKVADEP